MALKGWQFDSARVHHYNKIITINNTETFIMAAKKSRNEKERSEEKIDRWSAAIKGLQDSIKDRAAQIAGGFIDIPSSELLVTLGFITKEVDMIGELQALIDEERGKK